MKNKKKSFYFQDYIDSEFINNKKIGGIKISLHRVNFLSFIFFILIIIFGIKVIYLSLSPHKNFYSKNESIKLCQRILMRFHVNITHYLILYFIEIRLNSHGVI